MKKVLDLSLDSAILLRSVIEEGKNRSEKDRLIERISNFIASKKGSTSAASTILLAVDFEDANCLLGFIKGGKQEKENIIFKLKEKGITEESFAIKVAREQILILEEIESQLKD